MRNILEVQMPRYRKIMLGNCCNIRSSLCPPSSLQLWVATNVWSDPRTDPTIPFWLLLSFFLQHYLSILYFLPLHSPMVGWILDRVPGHTSIGCSWNFIHMVTGDTPGQINRNGTVCLHSPKQVTQVRCLVSKDAVFKTSNSKYVDSQACWLRSHNIS